ncbi:MAG: Cys-tRNA(Pro) deacylase [Acidimicrobiales bacterium]
MTPAVVLLGQRKIPHEVISYHHDPEARSYGAEAAEVLRLDPSQVFKTLVAEVAELGLTVAVVPVSAKLDLKALAKAVDGKKAKMADVDDVERTTGYVVGGISPLGLKKRLPTVIDSSAVDLDQMYVSGGRRGLEVRLAPSDLATLTNATVATITKG